jgi:hypothetical protein
MKKQILLLSSLLLQFQAMLWGQNYLCKQCDKVLLTELDLINAEDWSLLRNEIYACHGYIFENKNLTNYFLEAGWGYKPVHKKVDNLLNPIEKKNIAFIAQHEKNGFNGFEAFLAEFKKAVLTNNRQKVIAMTIADFFVVNPKNGRDDYEMWFDESVKKAFQQTKWTKSVNFKEILLDGYKSCGRQFYFTKKLINGKATWMLSNVVAPG